LSVRVTISQRNVGPDQTDITTGEYRFELPGAQNTIHSFQPDPSGARVDLLPALCQLGPHEPDL
jgi:hypothetical protein